ncbi:hypothetical protein [Jeotgalibaca arthritidis]|uniref:Uncharacterized protein n=1 Tax=Jeotgalibaca arthritidis TaxID=1868794 RepID=A0A6G7KBG5_9LACT|nr:hypothetical protein [Jeotgalibaca arthritidis]QII82614.1 hypothetical protein G7057_09340 [Jeotgalibaca arthritidis]
MEKKAEEMIENNSIEFNITLSLIEQLIDNHDSLVKIAQKVEKKELTDYTAAYEVLRLSGRTTNSLTLAHRLVSGMNDSNEEILADTTVFG